MMLFASQAYSQPNVISVEGTVQDDQEITISGTNFGDNQNYAQLISDGFENGTIGKGIEAGDWMTDSETGQGIYSTENPRTGTKSVHWKFSAIDSNEFYHKYQDIGKEEELYATFYFYNAESQGRIMKMARFNSGDVYNGTPSLYLQGYAFDYADYDYKPYTGANGGDAGDEGSFDYTKLDFNKWYRVEMYLKLSDPGVANGIAEVNYVGVSMARDTNRVTRGTNEADSYLNKFMLGQGLATVHSVGDIYIDDVFVANSYARIEIGNKSDFSSCSHREIQHPSRWTSDSINIKVNQGTFKDGEKAYLFVVDSNGNVSSGYPVTFSSNTGGSDLPHPSNLRIK
jgi:hypothetical protein